jgi:hypothetical protein
MKLFMVSYYDPYDGRDRFNTNPRRIERAYVAAISAKAAVDKINRYHNVKKSDLANTKAIPVKTGKPRIIFEFDDGYPLENY